MAVSVTKIITFHKHNHNSYFVCQFYFTYTTNYNNKFKDVYEKETKQKGLVLIVNFMFSGKTNERHGNIWYCKNYTDIYVYVLLFVNNIPSTSVDYISSHDLNKFKQNISCSGCF